MDSESSLTLEQKIKIQEEINALRSPLTGKWPSLRPPEAVIEATKYEKELKNYLTSHKLIITTAGNIGIGKTTFTRIFSHRLDIEGSYELHAEKDHINDELLAKFLRDKRRYCFELQQHFLSKRLKLREQTASKGVGCIEDRTPEEDPAVFHQRFYQQNYLSASQLEQLRNEAIEAYKKSPPSDIMIILLCNPKLCRIRILERGRQEEIGAWTLEELSHLAKLYENFPHVVKEYSLHKGPIFTFNLDQINITDDIHRGYIYEQILNSLK